MNTASSLTNEHLKIPNGETKILLHCCCAPCSVSILSRMLDSDLEPTIFFYNPNIHPKEEYDIRKQEIQRFAEERRTPFIDADYDTEKWFQKTKGLEHEPERGKRCTKCFNLRLQKSAEYAKKYGFSVFTTSLSISRWKDLNQVNAAGEIAGEKYDILYWDFNWRKKGGTQYMAEMMKQKKFYRQQYCGCVYSMRK